MTNKPVKPPAPTQDDLIAALAPDAAAADKWAGNQVQGVVLRLKLQANPEFMAGKRVKRVRVSGN